MTGSHEGAPAMERSAASDEVAPAMERSAALHERALRSLPGGSTRSTLFVAPHPPYAARGEGHEIVDVDGHRVIDLQNNYTALIHGHAFAPVVQAAELALREGSAFGLPTASEIDLAECLADRVEWAQQWRFANSGTEAVMMAVRAARAATGRELVVLFADSYHGSWDAVVRAGARGVSRGAQQETVVLPVGDADAFAAAVSRHGRELAAVLIDLMPNRAGLRPLEPAFVRLVREETERRGIALIVDEVITFRLAAGGLHKLYGVQGDLIALGKMIGGGFAVGAIGGSPQWMEVFDPRGLEPVAHGGTFSANPVTMRAGLAALRAFGQTDIERVDALGERLRTGLRARGWTVTGQGSLLQVQVPDPVALWWALYREGVLVAANGLMCVSTPMDERAIDRALEAFERVGQRDGERLQTLGAGPSASD